ncbi:hypothetical protein M0805_007314 [Coniferiporia weirii]|nr:hypothetical protein M0805_007314 [Coniferiporia weirii]
MAFLRSLRLTVLVAALLFSAVALGLSANYLSKFSSFTIVGVVSVSVPAWVQLAIASAAITIVFVLPMIVIDFLRRGALTSWILTELIVLTIISVLWLADAADVTANSNLSYLADFGLPQTCHGLDELAKDVDTLEISNPAQYGFLSAIDFDQFGMLCRSQMAIQAFGFLNWILLMGYAIVLLILAIVASYRGRSGIWTTTVRDAEFSAPKVEDGEVPMAEHVYA